SLWTSLNSSLQELDLYDQIDKKNEHETKNQNVVNTTMLGTASLGPVKWSSGQTFNSSLTEGMLGPNSQQSMNTSQLVQLFSSYGSPFYVYFDFSNTSTNNVAHQLVRFQTSRSNNTTREEGIFLCESQCNRITFTGLTLNIAVGQAKIVKTWQNDAGTALESIAYNYPAGYVLSASLKLEHTENNTITVKLYNPTNRTYGTQNVHQAGQQIFAITSAYYVSKTDPGDLITTPASAPQLYAFEVEENLYSIVRDQPNCRSRKLNGLANINMQMTTYDADVSVEEVISKESLWKEVRYANDIELKLVLKSVVTRASGLGYKFASAVFKPHSYDYNYMRGSERVNAFVTSSINNVFVTSENGPLPTDFGIDELQYIGVDTLVYLDYYDDSNAFKNMVYIRSLDAQFNDILLRKPHNTGYDTEITLPCCPSGKHLYSNSPRNITLSYQGVMLSTQYTDAYAVNSLRFIFKCTAADRAVFDRMVYNGIEASAITTLYMNSSGPTTTGRFSFISLIPSNDAYQTPIQSSVTVRQDLDKDIAKLREEFNSLSQEIAVNQLIETAMLPLDVMSTFGAISSGASTISTSIKKVSKQFSKSKASITLTSFKNLSDVIDTVPTNQIAKSLNHVSKRSIGTQFEDITAAVVKKTMDKGIGTDDMAELITDIADSAIPIRAYRVIDKSESAVYEISSTGKAIKYNTELTQLPFDEVKFKKLISESPVISAIIDFQTLKLYNQTFGKISTDMLDNFLASNPELLLKMVNEKNP
ncbi:VP4, partial [Rotavirus D]